MAVLRLPRLLDALDLALDYAKYPADGLSLPVQKLVTARGEGLLRLRIVKEAVDVFEAALRYVLKQLKPDDLIDFRIDVQALALE